jgi:hypothetical protein
MNYNTRYPPNGAVARPTGRDYGQGTFRSTVTFGMGKPSDVAMIVAGQHKPAVWEYASPVPGVVGSKGFASTTLPQATSLKLFAEVLYSPGTGVKAQYDDSVEIVVRKRSLFNAPSPANLMSQDTEAAAWLWGAGFAAAKQWGGDLDTDEAVLELAGAPAFWEVYVRPGFVPDLTPNDAVINVSLVAKLAVSTYPQASITHVHPACTVPAFVMWDDEGAYTGSWLFSQIAANPFPVRQTAARPTWRLWRSEIMAFLLPPTDPPGAPPAVARLFGGTWLPRVTGGTVGGGIITWDWDDYSNEPLIVPVVAVSNLLSIPAASVSLPSGVLPIERPVLTLSNATDDPQMVKLQLLLTDR